MGEALSRAGDPCLFPTQQPTEARVVEVDETYIGGLSKNMHKSVRAEKITGGGMVDKTAVIGVLNRGGEVRATLFRTRRLRP